MQANNKPARPLPQPIADIGKSETESRKKTNIHLLFLNDHPQAITSSKHRLQVRTHYKK